MSAMADDRRDDDQDATEPHEPVPGAESGGEETAFLGGGDETSVLPPSSGGPGAPPPEPKWAARAGVPPTGPSRYETPTEQWQEEEQPGRSWWLPAVLGIVALALLGVLGAGIVLILNSFDNEPAPVPTNTPTGTPPTPTAATPSPTPTPSATPSPTPPPQVAIPNVINMTRLAAEQALVAVGLTAVTETRVVEGATPGRVVEAQPAVGTLVPIGSKVTLIVAAVPRTSAPPTTPPTSPPPS
jgi:hypothetical protein